MKSKRVCLTCNPGRDELYPVLPLVGFPQLRAFFLAFMRNLLKLRGTKTAIYLFYLIFILHLPQRIKLQKEIYIITKIAQFTGQEKVQKKSSKLHVILSELPFVIDRVARKPNRSQIACRKFGS